jgi:hypothetical protein
MNSHKPTFTVSPARRPLIQRLTPLAWTLIGLAAVVAVLACIAVAIVLASQPKDDWATPTPAPTATSTPVLPTATATHWAESIATFTPEPEPGYPAWWADEMTQDEDGKWWAPDEVADMVREHYREYVNLYYTLVETTPPDMDALEAALPSWASGPQLEDTLGILAEMREGDRPIAFAIWESSLHQVQDWSADGLECTMGWVGNNGTYYEHDSLTSELLLEEHREDSGLILTRMRYDPVDGHWKRDEFLDYIPPGG